MRRLFNKLPLRTFLSAGALVLAGGYLLFSFLGPGGIRMVLEKRQQIRVLQDGNADLKREIEERRKRIHTFSEKPAERQRHVREDLGLVKEGETNFMLPDQKK